MLKRIMLIGLIAVGIIGMTQKAMAQGDLKIGYIDSQRIFAEYRQTQEAEQVYKKEVDAWKAQAATMEQEIVKLQEDIRSQSLMLSEEKQREKKLEYDRKVDEYKRFMDDTFGEEGLAAKRNQELTQPIVEKINRILEQMAQQDGITLVFDIAQANIVYASKNYDLTERVLEELNKQP